MQLFTYCKDRNMIKVATYCVLFNKHCRLQCQLLFLFNIISNVAELLLHLTNCLKVSRVVESIATQQQQLTTVTTYCTVHKYYSYLQDS